MGWHTKQIGTKYPFRASSDSRIPPPFGAFLKEKTGAFFVPGFAKFVVIKKPATKARKGINPFTKEPTVFKAKPARKIIRARPVKAAKDAIA